MREKLAVYLGLGSTRVKPWPREARKSVGAERCVFDYSAM